MGNSLICWHLGEGGGAEVLVWLPVSLSHAQIVLQDWNVAFTLDCVQNVTHL
jgi:hypothetical protein